MLGEKVLGKKVRQNRIVKLDPEDVLTSEQSGKLLAPFIKPLPSFDEVMSGRRQAARGSPAFGAG